MVTLFIIRDLSSIMKADTLPFVKLVRIKSLNPVPNRNVTPFLISKNCWCFKCISQAESKKIQIQRVHYY